MTRNQKITFWAILGVLVFFLFFRLGRQDMVTDDGHYALRSLGYFDYMGSQKQTTPIQWFGYRPWWSYLSFHDHPPMFFLVQHIFFKLFGASLIVSRLPSVFAAIGTALAAFFFGKRLGGARLGLFAMSALVLNTLFLWMGRIGLLEGVFSFFLFLGTFFLVKALEENDNYFFGTAISFGVAFLTKYTFLFVLPGVFALLVWKYRSVFRNRKFWLGVLLFVVISSPILIYNLNMYQMRGHFDIQFSDLFGQGQEDWSNLRKRFSVSQNFWGGVLEVLGVGFSWPYFAIFIASLVLSAYIAYRKDRSVFYLPIFIAISLFVFFGFVGATSRWLGVFTPFAALTIGVALDFLAVSRLFQKFKYACVGSAVVLILYLGFYNLNTNHLYKAVGNNFFRGSIRLENYGYNQLDKKITGLLSDKISSGDIQTVINSWWYTKFEPSEIDFPSIRQGKDQFRSIIVYDSNSLWFPMVWIFERWKLYHRMFIVSAEEFLLINREEKGREVLKALDLENIYFIQAGPEIVANGDTKFPESQQLVDIFQKQGIEPELIKDNQGREAFYIYKGTIR